MMLKLLTDYVRKTKWKFHGTGEMAEVKISVCNTSFLTLKTQMFFVNTTYVIS